MPLTFLNSLCAQKGAATSHVGALPGTSAKLALHAQLEHFSKAHIARATCYSIVEDTEQGQTLRHPCAYASSSVNGFFRRRVGPLIHNHAAVSSAKPNIT